MVQQFLLHLFAIGEVVAERLVRLLQADVEEAKQTYSECGEIGACVDQYISDWDHACVVIVGGRALNHSLRLASLCTCREFILYTGCEHSVFVDGLDLPIRARIRNFDLFKSSND
jgi:hypothetical protein